MNAVSRLVAVTLLLALIGGLALAFASGHDVSAGAKSHAGVGAVEPEAEEPWLAASPDAAERDATYWPARASHAREEPSRSAKGARLRGSVRDPDGAPVSGAEVELASRAGETFVAVTDATGSYVVEGLVVGVEYVATARSDAWTAPAEPVRVRADAKDRALRLDLSLGATGTLDVVLVDERGEPLGSGVVEVGTEPRRQSGPNEDDRWRFSYLDPGTTSVTVRSDWGTTASAVAVVEPGRTTTVTVALDRGAVVQGVVVGRDGKPILGATVEAMAWGSATPPDGEAWPTARKALSDSQGRFTIVGLPAGETRLRARRETREDVHRTAEPVRAFAPAEDVRVVLAPYARATWTLRLRDGTPYVGHVHVSFHGTAEANVGWMPATKGGVVRLRRIPPGAGRFRAKVQGYVFLESPEFVVRLGDDIDLGEGVLDAGLVLRGRVVDDSGKPVRSIAVFGTSTGGISGFAGFTSERGEFEIPGTLPGITRVHTNSHDYVDAVVETDLREGSPPVEIVVSRGALLRGELETPDQRPWSRTIRVFPADPGATTAQGAVQEITTLSSGDFQVRLPSGRYRLALSTPQGDLPLGEVLIVGEETVERTFTVQAR
jgi:hypothetical protein